MVILKEGQGYLHPDAKTSIPYPSLMEVGGRGEEGRIPKKSPFFQSDYRRPDDFPKMHKIVPKNQLHEPVAGHEEGPVTRSPADTVPAYVTC